MLLLFWLVLGAGIGILTSVAGLVPPEWRSRRWLVLPLLSMLIAAVAGWLAALLVGAYDATAVVLWVAVAGTVGLPWLLVRIERAVCWRS